MMLLLFQAVEGDWLKLVLQYVGPYSLVIVILLLLHRMGLIGKPDFSGMQAEMKEVRESIQRVTESLLKTIHDINESRTGDINRIADAMGKLSDALNAWTKAQKK